MSMARLASPASSKGSAWRSPLFKGADPAPNGQPPGWGFDKELRGLRKSPIANWPSVALPVNGIQTRSRGGSAQYIAFKYICCEARYASRLGGRARRGIARQAPVFIGPPVLGRGRPPLRRRARRPTRAPPGAAQPALRRRPPRLAGRRTPNPPTRSPITAGSVAAEKKDAHGAYARAPKRIRRTSSKGRGGGQSAPPSLRRTWCAVMGRPSRRQHPRHVESPLAGSRPPAAREPQRRRRARHDSQGSGW